jgi:ABC-type transport system substrate-binding protein
MQMAIDLPSIAKDYYHGTVEPYPSTVTSRYMTGWGYPYEDWPQDLKDEYAYNPPAAKQLLSDAGYPDGFKTNIVADTGGDLDLLQIVKSYFTQVGIEMEIRPMESAACTAFVAIDRKYDQLVYRPYGPLGHDYAPRQAIMRFHSTTLSNWLMVNDPVIDAFYPRASAATTEDELKQIVRNMDERVARQHFAVSLLQPMEYSLCQPWLKGYHGQIHSIWMGIGGPSRLSFYGARFWIDQKLKKSMGH